MNLDDTTTTAPTGDTSYLDRPGGRIGYDVAGAGPLVVLVPGIGDLRAAYRFLAPALRAAGYRVACTDLRGHGDSDATFSSYGDEETADDVAALIGELGGSSAVLRGAQRGSSLRGRVSARRERPHRFPAARRHRRGERLQAWADRAEASPVSELRGFANGLRKDWAAVTARLTLPYSSGVVEGHVNRIKMIKDRCTDEPTPTLLRKRVLLAD